MTAETERRVPEHPGWMPSMIRLVEFDGKAVCIFDRWFGLRDGDPEWVRDHPRYLVARRGVIGPTTWTSRKDQQYDDLADAEAAFELACERLREGG